MAIKDKFKEWWKKHLCDWDYWQTDKGKEEYRKFKQKHRVDER